MIDTSKIKEGDFFMSNSIILESYDNAVVLPNKKYRIDKIIDSNDYIIRIEFCSELGRRIIRVDNYLYSGKIICYSILDERKAKLEQIWK